MGARPLTPMAQSSSGGHAPQACHAKAVQGCSPGSPTGLPCGPDWVPSPRWPGLLWGPLAPRGHSPFPAATELGPEGLVSGWLGHSWGQAPRKRLCPPPTPAAPGCGRQWAGGRSRVRGEGAGRACGQPSRVDWERWNRHLVGLNSGGAVGAALCPLPPRPGHPLLSLGADLRCLGSCTTPARLPAQRQAAASLPGLAPACRSWEVLGASQRRWCCAWVLRDA